MGKIYTLCYSCNPRIGQIQNWEKIHKQIQIQIQKTEG